MTDHDGFSSKVTSYTRVREFLTNSRHIRHPSLGQIKKPCLISTHLSGPCSACHQHCNAMHLPAGGGFYCCACCPVCRVRSADVPLESKEIA